MSYEQEITTAINLRNSAKSTSHHKKVESLTIELVAL